MKLSGFIAVVAAVSGMAFLAQTPLPAAQKVTVAWDASPDPNVSGYAVYFGPASRAYTNVVMLGKVTMATISNLADGGTYYFAVTARSATGMESEYSNEVSYSAPAVPVVTTARLTVRIKGSGSSTPDYNGQELSLGKSYTITAVPAAGQVFAGWSGGKTSAVSRLTFIMATGLELEANFIPSPYVPVAGNYNGLFYEDDAVRQNRSGIFTVSVTSRGTCSGRLQLGAARHAFSSKLDLDCRAASDIPRSASNVLQLRLRFGRGLEADQVFGNVSDGSWTATLEGDRAVFHALTNPAPFAGNYTVILPAPGGGGSPAGDGFGSLRITPAGRLSFSGYLADNARIGQTVAVSKHGQWPCYASLYSGKGSALSWLTFQPRAQDDLHGWLSWIKAADPLAQFYPLGFTNVLSGVGSAFVAPVGDTNSLVKFTNATVRFCGGELPANFTNGIALTLKDKVINLGTNTLSLTFARTTGKFTGRVLDPVNGVSRAFKGAVLQKANVGYGFLPTTNQCSRVIVQP